MATQESDDEGLGCGECVKRFGVKSFHLSNDQSLGDLLYNMDCTIQLYGDSDKPLIRRISMNQSVEWS